MPIPILHSLFSIRTSSIQIAVAVFDGNGHMFVAEMRAYMQNIDGKKQFDKVSRISAESYSLQNLSAASSAAQSWR